MIKAVLFDLDDTLRSFMVTKNLACDAAIDAMIAAGLQMKRNDALKRLFELYDKYGIEDKLIFQKFLRNVNGNIDYRVLAAGIFAYRQAADRRNVPIPGVIPTLVALKKMGMKLGIVSNAPSLKAWLRLTESGMRDYFDFVVAFNDTGKRKPHPKPFATAINRIGENPGEILFVGDDLIRDIRGARKIGMKTALADYETHHPISDIEKSAPDYVLHKPEELLTVIKREMKHENQLKFF